MQRRRRWRRQRGTVMAEFIIAVIPFFLLISGVIQLALISAAKLAVHYAAACAARAAVVIIPEEEEHGKEKQGNDRIRDAAMVALLPIAPSGKAQGNLINGFGKGAGWSELSRVTGVLVNQGRLGSDEYDAQITTRVVFAFHCTIPMASRFFCSTPGELPQAARHDMERAKLNPGAGRYLILRAEHTLTKQGRPNPQANPEKEM